MLIDNNIDTPPIPTPELAQKKKWPGWLVGLVIGGVVYCLPFLVGIFWFWAILIFGKVEDIRCPLFVDIDSAFFIPCETIFLTLARIVWIPGGLVLLGGFLGGVSDFKYFISGNFSKISKAWLLICLLFVGFVIYTGLYGYRQAVITAPTSLEDCDITDDPYEESACIRTLAIRQNDPSFCQYIGEESQCPYRDHPDRDHCYDTFINATQDYTVCGLKEDVQSQFLCVLRSCSYTARLSGYYNDNDYEVCIFEEAEVFSNQNRELIENYENYFGRKLDYKCFEISNLDLRNKCEEL